MTAFYIVLKVSALLAIIILPLFGPKKKKTPLPQGLSDLSVNENGLLEVYTVDNIEHHPVQKHH
ncbi:hypothetical protein [Mucilaginibacter flavidus]|uniref:hypothetical protein n=1 Tax=Mucilaginibacter flavidus TaxID=2949309 RepID=UPI002093842E|nr:hypothetical protein [Mucilaginibacter flavidus]MCO5946416.1 hypothetical protein [Mucilaginibacter flavidus]